VAFIGFGGEHALASAGCDAVNAGALNAPAGGAVKAVGGLAVGDTVTFTITVTGPGGWTLSSGNNTILAATAVSGTQSYTVKGTNADTTLVQITGVAVTVTATCVPAPASSSGRLRTLQFLVTNVEALTSGDAISSAEAVSPTAIAHSSNETVMGSISTSRPNRIRLWRTMERAHWHRGMNSRKRTSPKTVAMSAKCQ
jgi:hypothetical protein